MTDKRRINGPIGGSKPPVFASEGDEAASSRPVRSRVPLQPRRIFLKTGLTPSASGSAYYELEPSIPPASESRPRSLIPTASSLKLTCTVHGPRPLARSSAYSSQLVLSTYVKFTPFATRFRRGYVRDNSERDLGARLETALRGIIIGNRWPKSGVDVVVTILEGEEDRWWGDDTATSTEGVPGAASPGTGFGIGGCGLFTVLAGCITVASAALVDAGIDCVDLAAGGVAALVRQPVTASDPSTRASGHEPGNGHPGQTMLVADPCPAEHQQILAICLVCYLASRDEVTELWVKGAAENQLDELIDTAIGAAVAAKGVVASAVLEGVSQSLSQNAANETDATPAEMDI